MAELEARMTARELVEQREYDEMGAEDLVLRELEARALARLEKRTRKRK